MIFKNARQRFAKATLPNQLLVGIGIVSAVTAVAQFVVGFYGSWSTSKQVDRLIYAEEGFRKDQRAWISTSEPYATTPRAFNDDSKLETGYKLINTGRTPALQATVRVNWSIMYTPGPPGPVGRPYGGLRFPDIPAELSKVREEVIGFLPPQASMSLNANISVNASMAEAFRTRRAFLYEYGIAKYKDTYGDWHFTKYCMVLNTDGGFSGGSNFAFGACPFHNEGN